MSRSRVNVPLYPTGETISFQEALVTPLADSVGLSVVGMESIDDLFTLYEAQGRLILAGADIETPRLDHALRDLRTVHKRESTFSACQGSTIGAVLLVPLSPQWSVPDVNALEKKMNAPLRISFGITKIDEQKQEDNITAMRSTVSIHYERQSIANKYKVAKDTPAIKENSSKEVVENWFWSNNRAISSISSFIMRNELVV